MTNTWNKIRYSLYQPFYDIIAYYFRPYRKASIESLNVQPDEKVLVLGAGTGLDLEFLQEVESITAIDITPAILQKLDRRAQKLGMKVKTTVMDGSNLEFDDETFDVVILHLIVAVIPDPVSCLLETERVLTPGGRFTIMDKFVTPGSKTPFFRNLINPLTNVLATSVNRDVDQLLETTGLTKTHHSKLGSIFWLIQGMKPGT